MTFKVWMQKVDKLISSEAGISIHDLPDMCFRDMFDDGCTPEEVVEEALQEFLFN
jgi:hypothetical protein